MLSKRNMGSYLSRSRQVTVVVHVPMTMTALRAKAMQWATNPSA